jgi:hypothetical protein
MRRISWGTYLILIIFFLLNTTNYITERVFLAGILVWGGGGVQLRPLGAAATNRPIVPAPGDYDDGEIGGIIGRGNRNTRIKPAPMPLCPPQTAHVARTRTRAAAVGSQRLTAWATARTFLAGMLWAHIWKVLGSNLGWNTGYPY